MTCLLKRPNEIFVRNFQSLIFKSDFVVFTSLCTKLIKFTKGIITVAEKTKIVLSSIKGTINLTVLKPDAPFANSL